MKILFIDSYYKNFLNYFYKNNEKKKTFLEQRRELLKQNFGTSDFYSYYLSKLGHNCEDLIVNDYYLQRLWAKENKFSYDYNPIKSYFQLLPFLHRYIGRPRWIQEIVLKQISFYKPDIVYVQDLSILNADVLKQAKKYSKLLVGQIASSLPNINNVKQFDLIVTSFPHYVKYFRKIGVNSEYLPLAFDERILNRINYHEPRHYDVSFIGSFTPNHKIGTSIIRQVNKFVPIDIWGQGLFFPIPRFDLLKRYHGAAWALDMYRILAQSKIVINRHIDVSENYANNMRLYEATGMGALLITDNKKNLGDLFEVGKEVIEYEDPEELVQKIKYYLEHDKEMAKIANAGQKRTLKDHVYTVRMRELNEIFKKYL
jgi:hypothetical protein